MSYLCQKCQKLRISDFVSEVKRAENYPDFEKNGALNSARPKEIYSKNIQRKSTEANDLRHILEK